MQTLILIFIVLISTAVSSIYLNNGEIEPDLSSSLSSFRTEWDSYIVLWANEFTVTSLKTLIPPHLNFSTSGVIARNCIRIIAPGETMKFLHQHPQIAWIGQIKPEQKISRSTLSAYDRTGENTIFIEKEAFVTKDFFFVIISEYGKTSRISETAAKLENASKETLITIASLPYVHFISKSQRIRPQIKYTRPWVINGISNASTVQSIYDQNVPLMVNREFRLTGRGQIIGVADTGLNAQHCFFYDYSRSSDVTLFNTNSPPNKDNIIIDSTHRKIINYISLSNPIRRDINGHGTIVAGIIAGDPPNHLEFAREFQGIAPKAKLSIFDLSLGLSTLLPDSLLTGFFDYAYLAGARIHCNAWSGIRSMDETNYEAYEREIDLYVWQHQDFLPIVAAGIQECPQTSKLLSFPGQSKNALSIGASFTSKAAFDDYIDSNILPLLRSEVPPTLREQVLSSPFNLAGNTPPGPTRDLRTKPDLVAPGDYIYSANHLDFNDPVCEGVNDPIDSRGDVYFDRRNTGSSISTAVVTGLVALLREYMQSTTSPMYASQPSAALMKAAMIAGAVQPDEVVKFVYERKLGAQCMQPQLLENIDLSLFYGFGYARLNTIIPSALSNFTVHLPGHAEAADSRTFGDPYFEVQGDSQSFQYCVKNTEDRLKIVLAWTDPPADSAAFLQLVNDLDLIVNVGGSEFHGNKGKSPDRDFSNNVEVVEINSLDGTFLDLNITIVATALPENSNPQPFAVVLRGNVLQGTCSEITQPAESNEEDGLPEFLGLAIVYWIAIVACFIILSWMFCFLYLIYFSIRVKYFGYKVIYGKKRRKEGNVAKEPRSPTIVVN